MFTHGQVGVAAIVVGYDVFGIDPDGLIVVIDGAPVFAQIVIGDPPVVVGRRILRVVVDGQIVVLYGA